MTRPMTTKTKIEHLFIVGAGFSNNAGLPLTSNFSEKLLVEIPPVIAAQSRGIAGVLESVSGEMKIFARNSPRGVVNPVANPVFAAADVPADGFEYIDGPREVGRMRNRVAAEALRLGLV